jgi:uncharacterized RDD family membrane protein YckC
MAERYLTDTPLLVHPDLVGRPLAPPLRRVFAFLVDWALLIVPTVAVALGGGALALRASDPEGLRALVKLVTGRLAEPAGAGRDWQELARVLVRYEMPGVPAEALVAVEHGDLEAAAEAIGRQDFLFALALGPEEEETPAPGTVRVELQRFIPYPVRGAVLFAVPGLYFTVLGTRRGGRTLGKRLLGLELVRLDGERLSLWRSFERFGGYLGLLGTAGIGLADLWHDPNRRLEHDRGAETAVLRRVDGGLPVQPPADRLPEPSVDRDLDRGVDVDPGGAEQGHPSDRVGAELEA